MLKQERRRRNQQNINTRTVLAELFPQPPHRPLTRWQLTVRAALALVALAAGTVVELLRIAGRPPVDTIFAEDRAVFLVQALAGPGHLFASYAGYLQLLPRLIGELAALLPLPEAAAVFALCGAATAAAVALFVFQASAGHVRSVCLRVLLALTVLLLPVAPFEIIDSGVNAPWYLLFALFWAALWRPRTKAGLATAALAGFIASASSPLTLAIAPLFALRVAALRRFREHAVTAGWAAGLLLQLPVISASHHSRLGATARPGPVLAFYAHDVLLPAFGWHLSWLLQNTLGRNRATTLIGVLLGVIVGLVMITQPARVRLFTSAALTAGFLTTATGAVLSAWVTRLPVIPRIEPASRYSTLAIFLISAALIVAADSAVRPADQRRPAWHGLSRRGAGRRRLPGPAHVPTAVAVTALVAVFAAGWLPDFRIGSGRALAAEWAPVASQWLAACGRSASGEITVPGWETRDGIVIRCTNLRR